MSQSYLPIFCNGMSHLSVKDWALNKCFTWSGKLEEKFEIFGIFVLLVTKVSLYLYDFYLLNFFLYEQVNKKKMYLRKCFIITISSIVQY